MNNDEQNRDQAERLRHKIEQIKENPRASRASKKLPPRSEVHNQKRKKTKWKLKYPIIRLLVLFFILLPIIIFSIYTYNEKQRLGAENIVNSDTGGYERVDIERDEEAESKGEEETKKETEEIEEIESNKQTEVEESETTTEEQEGTTSQPNSGTSTDNTSTNEESKDNPAAEEKIIHHRVQANETLFRIAMKYYNSQAGVEIIKNANQLKGNEIQAGQVLVIPIKN